MFCLQPPCTFSRIILVVPYRDIKASNVNADIKIAFEEMYDSEVVWNIHWKKV